MIETFVGFFEVGALGFYLFCALLSIIYIVSTETHKYVLSSGLTFLALIIYHKPIIELLHNWKACLLVSIVYILIGAGWSLIRWYSFCKKYVAENINNPVSQYVITRSNENYPQLSETEIIRQYNIREIKKDLKPNNHISEIIGWIIYWPWSFIWNVMGDFMRGIYDILGRWYNRISNRIIDAAIKNINK